MTAEQPRTWMTRMASLPPTTCPTLPRHDSPASTEQQSLLSFFAYIGLGVLFSLFLLVESCPDSTVMDEQGCLSLGA